MLQVMSTLKDKLFILNHNTWEKKQQLMFTDKCQILVFKNMFDSFLELDYLILLISFNDLMETLQPLLRPFGLVTNGLVYLHQRPGLLKRIMKIFMFVSSGCSSTWHVTSVWQPLKHRENIRKQSRAWLRMSDKYFLSLPSCHRWSMFVHSFWSTCARVMNIKSDLKIQI